MFGKMILSHLSETLFDCGGILGHVVFLRGCYSMCSFRCSLPLYG
jgi:hypothetical protein